MCWLYPYDGIGSIVDGLDRVRVPEDVWLGVSLYLGAESSRGERDCRNSVPRLDLNFDLNSSPPARGDHHHAFSRVFSSAMGSISCSISKESSTAAGSVYTTIETCHPTPHAQAFRSRTSQCIICRRWRGTVVHVGRWRKTKRLARTYQKLSRP